MRLAVPFLAGPFLAGSLLALPVAALMLAPGSAAAAEAKGPTVRPEIGKPLQAARTAATKKRYKEALGEIGKAEAVGQKTDHERYVIDEMKAFVYVGMRQPAQAADALEAALKSGTLSQAERVKRLHALANLNYQAGQYGDAIGFANRAIKEGAAAADLRQLVAQSYYRKGDMAGAAREYERLVQDAERAGRTPPEDLLKTVLDVAYRQKDQPAYVGALQRMVTYHPTPAYWRDLLLAVRTQPGFSDDLSLDVQRLMLATGALTKPQEFMELGQQLLLANLPGEAESTLRRGFSNGVLGGGDQAARQQRLLDMASKQAAQQKGSLTSLAEAARKSGDAGQLAEAGLAHASFGEHEIAAGLLGEAVARAAAPAKPHLRLRLGIVQLAGGPSQPAQETLKLVTGADGAATLAKLWQIQGAEEA